ncbi:MAG: helix-turn-helix transcriptional regulator [Bacilli bacterium]|nr:helix-turn-helix transcriptional regulator [Bacilli bacterium]
MNQEKIGKMIKDIRLKDKLSQQKFADKYGVTYQAVSKWETGKNIPDISILKQICDDYDLDINDFLSESDSLKNKKKNNKFIYIIFGFILLVLLLILILNHLFKEDDFEFKTLSSNCSNFTITGSIAYNKNRSSIYISHVNYCGEDKDEMYKEINCSLYEKDGNINVEVTKCNYKRNHSITLEEFLKDVTFNIDNYKQICDVYSENSFYLEINATNREGENIVYKVPLMLEDNCIK